MGSNSGNGVWIRSAKSNVEEKAQHAARSRTARLVQRKDGTLVEMRPGFRPRVLSKAEVEALKLAAKTKKEQDENPFATMTESSSMSPTDA